MSATADESLVSYLHTKYAESGHSTTRDPLFHPLSGVFETLTYIYVGFAFVLD
jgi:hypothetical protein